jgi:solute carrier family 25 2-oxodicarboxylate transporter 21
MRYCDIGADVCGPSYVNRYPLDVVKTRVQLQTGKGTGANAYNGMLDCFQKIIRNEGYASTCYRHHKLIHAITHWLTHA